MSRVRRQTRTSRFPPSEFERPSLALKEVLDARIWAGIHFRTADVQASVIGLKVSHWLVRHAFQPVG